MTGQLSALAQGKAAGAPAGYTSKLLKTGQTTSYNDGDDGYYEVGVAKSYTINTSGAQSGTTNVDLAHYVGGAGAIAFNNTTHKITDSGNGLAIFKTNDVILTSSAANPGPFTVTTGNVAGEIVCSGATFTDETPAGAVTIYKREAMSNNTVLDNNTGLEWMRYFTTKMGDFSSGSLVWSGRPSTILLFVAACNAANVGGHNDWRYPNIFEVYSLPDYSSTSGTRAMPNAVAFPSFPTSQKIFRTATAFGQNATACKQTIESRDAHISYALNTNNTNSYFTYLLVRGGLA